MYRFIVWRWTCNTLRVKYRDASLTEDKIQAMSRAANLDSDRYKTYPPFDKNFNVWPSFTAL